jgi:endogenous inhibitor of DNA gyrase (YacG/DUF329 family)
MSSRIMSSRITSSGTAPLQQAKPCAVCDKPQTEAFRPFCSRRCADVDLHRWLSGAYALPATEDDAEDGPAVPRRADHGATEADE